nr:TPA_asm: hypothetical protein HUJ06_030637 [Nelumbo nucifera]
MEALALASEVCLSETSSISAAESSPEKYMKDRKDKAKVDQEAAKPEPDGVMESKVLLSLKFHHKELGESSSQPQMVASKLRVKKSGRRSFYCVYCRRTFESPQAYGGHQNAHRRERSLAKSQGLAPLDLRYPYARLHAYSRLPSTIVCGRFSRSSGLGLQPAVIHKQYHPWSLPGRSYFNGGWNRPEMLLMNRQPEIARLRRDDGLILQGAEGFDGDGFVNMFRGSQAIEASNAAANRMNDIERGNLEAHPHEEKELDLSLKL